MVTEALVRRLVAAQFPKWADLPIRPVAQSGWDNHTFHLGDQMLLRLPSAPAYAPQVEKEQRWLPYLAPHLPLSIPTPLAKGQPTPDFPHPWSIYAWLPGQPSTPDTDFGPLAPFLTALHAIDTSDGPPPGPHNFHRGGSLAIYDQEARQAIAHLQIPGALEVWEAALATSWQGSPLWVHGDISPHNLLTLDGRLSAVIDFGLLAVGDPACDLSIAFTCPGAGPLRDYLTFDDHTWLRARAWALWKALILATDVSHTSAPEYADPLPLIYTLLTP